MNSDDDATASPQTLVMLGADHGSYGRVDTATVGPATAAAITVGSDTESPSMQFKADTDVPNEDALCVIEAGDWAGFAVADAHYGPESSHTLLTRLTAIWSRISPTDIDHLGQMIEFLRNGDPPDTDSESTLLVVYFDRISRTGYGISFGDSTFMIVGPDRPPVALNQRDFRFVNTRDRGSLGKGAPFGFHADPDELMLTFTDGLNECHYRSPATSVQAQDIADLAAEHAYESLPVADGLTRLALSGVRGQPGGQDNVALIASRA